VASVLSCPRCRHENPPGAKFCIECASPFQPACGRCGTRLPPAAKFCPECACAADSPGARTIATPEAYTPQHLAERILDSRAALEGERKQVTVLLADMKGSMELLADRDPEEARRLLDPVLERMMSAVHRYEGTVNQVMGDGIMALFGAPLAHEDHAVRACYAALAMQESVGRYTEGLRRAHGVEVLIRVGLNSGEVVVRSIGSDLRMDYTAVGQTTHLAGRMEQLAVPGTIRLTGETLRLAEGYVAVKPLGPIPVKGLADPVEVHELTGAAAVRSRLQARRAQGLTRFVGRDEEMEQMRRAAQEARRGHGQLIAVVGEPGVGKSRLFYEFIHSHNAHDWLSLESGGVSYGRATPYLPVIDLVRAYFRIEAGDDVRAIRAKVTGNLLALDESLQEAIAPILWLLDALPEESPLLGIAPTERRRRTLAAIKRVLLRESQARPLLLVFEDLQWIDSETQAFLDSLVESLPTASVLLAVNYRPEYHHEWSGKTYYRQVRIDPLGPEGAEGLLAGLLGDDPSVAQLRTMLIHRTEGNPLFLEESVQALVETGALGGARGAYRLLKDLDSVRVPATVQAILAARIDRLAADDKRLLQTAAVVGPDVPFALLLAVAGLDEEACRSGLGRLLAGEFLDEARLFPELKYTFKHALTYDVAYGGLLSERRQALHRAIVGAVERLYADRLGEHVEQLAHHALRGEMKGHGVKYLHQAADKAVARSASREASTLLQQALRIIAELPETPERLAEAADMSIGLATSLIAVHGSGTHDVEMAYLRAREIAERLGDATRLYPALWGLWFVSYNRGLYPVATELSEQLLTTARDGSDTGRLLEAHHACWATACSAGDLAAAMTHLEHGMSLYDPVRHRSQTVIYGGHDPGVCARYHLALVQWLLGYPDRASVALREALSMAEELGHPLTTAITLTFTSWVHYQRGELVTAREHARRYVTLAEAQGFEAWVDDGRAVLACIGAQDGADAWNALQRLVASRGRSAWRNVISLCLFAEAFGRLGDPGKGIEALGLIPEEHREIIFAPEIQRIRGDLLLARGESQEAEHCLRRAIEAAGDRSERSFELRAATSLARLLDGRGKRDEAREVLAPICKWFTEGHDTTDVREARALLGALA
jgi:class 3 adenylate cyclase/tetratricopeptide (TPR) repeat protein